MSHYNKQFLTFFRDEQVAPVCSGTSRSPLKGKLLLEYIKAQKLDGNFPVVGGFEQVSIEDLLTAHTAVYVKDFLIGHKPGCCGSGLQWSPELVESVLWTNGSLKAALEHACEHPEQVTFSPTAGFHHARPNGGSGFCTFSGQVIASLAIYKAKGLKGAWIDMDGHFGNSIGDSAHQNPEVDKAIVMNINPRGIGASYLTNLWSKLQTLRQLVVEGKVDYVAVAHGADSHFHDDLCGEGALTTTEWVLAGQMVYAIVASASQELGRAVPLCIALFGGYRSDDYESVLRLHTLDLLRGLKLISNVETGVEGDKLLIEQLEADTRTINKAERAARKAEKKARRKAKQAKAEEANRSLCIDWFNPACKHALKDDCQKCGREIFYDVDKQTWTEIDGTDVCNDDQSHIPFLQLEASI